MEVSTVGELAHCPAVFFFEITEGFVELGRTDRDRYLGFVVVVMSHHHPVIVSESSGDFVELMDAMLLRREPNDDGAPLHFCKRIGVVFALDKSCPR